MLKAIPKRWFAWDFTIIEGSSSQALAEIDVSWWREKGVLTVQGTSYRVYREGLVSGAFILESAASVLARAEKPSALRRSFIIEHSGTQYTLCAKSVFRRAFLLLTGIPRTSSDASSVRTLRNPACGHHTSFLENVNGIGTPPHAAARRRAAQAGQPTFAAAWPGTRGRSARSPLRAPPEFHGAPVLPAG